MWQRETKDAGFFSGVFTRTAKSIITESPFKNSLTWLHAGCIRYQLSVIKFLYDESLRSYEKAQLNGSLFLMVMNTHTHIYARVGEVRSWMSAT